MTSNAQQFKGRFSDETERWGTEGAAMKLIDSDRGWEWWIPGEPRQPGSMDTKRFSHKSQYRSPQKVISSHLSITQNLSMSLKD